MKKQAQRLLLLLGSAVLAETGAPSTGRVIAMDNPAIRGGVLLVNPSARKVYAGRGSHARDVESGFWVHDMDFQGEVSGSDERGYSFLDEPLAESKNKGNFLYVSSLALSPDGRKLYLGLAGSPHDERHCLVVQDLDEKGEPKGKPRSFDMGIAVETPVIWCHPRFKSLFIYSPRQRTLCAVPLDKGAPSEKPQSLSVSKGGGAITSFVTTENGNDLLFGTSLGGLEVLPLDPTGMPDPSLAQSFSLSESPGALKISRAGNTLFYALNETLWSRPITRAAEPDGKPALLPPWKALDVRCGARGALYVVLGEGRAEGGKAAQSAPAGARIARFQPDAQGKPGAPIFLSEIFEGQIIRTWAADDSTGNVYVSLAPISQ